MALTPYILYGTAWKKEKTKDYVLMALKNGYRGIDTANQLIHYFERGVGEALLTGYDELGLSRTDLFLQSKYTYVHGQGPELPYQVNASITEQVEQSFASSLTHLHTDYLDSYLLHGPMTREGLISEDFEAWQAITGLYQKGATRAIGVSNMNAVQLVQLCEKAQVLPHFVQNRCYASMGWDDEVRKICQLHGIVYQGFSLLTANLNFLGGQIERSLTGSTPKAIFDQASNTAVLVVQKLMSKYQKTAPQIIFRLSRDLSMLPLTGTTSEYNMKMNLEIEDFTLLPDERQALLEMAKGS